MARKRIQEMTGSHLVPWAKAATPRYVATVLAIADADTVVIELGGCRMLAITAGVRRQISALSAEKAIQDGVCERVDDRVRMTEFGSQVVGWYFRKEAIRG